MAKKLNILVDQGTDYSANIYVTDSSNTLIDLVTGGYSANAYIRKTYSSLTGTAFVTTIGSVGGQTGILTLSLSSTASANLTAGRYVYDVIVKSSANVRSRAVEGIITVMPRVAK